MTRRWIAAGLLCATPFAAMAQSSVGNKYDLDNEKRFWAEVRERDKQQAQRQEEYRESMRSSWSSQATARRVTPQSVRLLAIIDKVEASGGRISAADLTEAGFDLFFGDGVPRDSKEGLELLTLAADEKNWKSTHAHYAQFVLGNIYWKGLNIHKDQKAGLEWYRKSAKNGNVLALALLAEWFLTGKEVPKDYAEAQQMAAGLEKKLLAPPVVPLPGSPPQQPGTNFYDDTHRANAAMLVAAVALVVQRDAVKTVFWAEKAEGWGCKGCVAELRELIEKFGEKFPMARQAAPTQPSTLNLGLYGLTVTIAPERGAWTAGSMELDGKRVPVLRLSPGDVPVDVTLDYQPGKEWAANCVQPMFKEEFDDKPRKIFLSSLEAQNNWLDHWYPIALGWNNEILLTCREVKGGYVMVSIISPDPARPKDWERSAFVAMRPVVDEVIAAWKK